MTESRHSGARHFIDLLESEHLDIFRALYEHVRFGRAYDVSKLLVLCRQIHRHLAAEFGVFYERAADELDEKRLLSVAGDEYQRAMTAISEIRGGNQSFEVLHVQLERLLEIFKQHIDRTEGIEGLHERAQHLPMDWEDLSSRYVQRCQELDGWLNDARGTPTPGTR